MITRFFYAILFVGMMAILPAAGIHGLSSEALADSQPEMEEVKGKIVEINVQANVIRLEPGVLGMEKDLHVTPTTKIVVNGKPGNIGQLRKGDKVKVNYAEGKDDLRTAEYIEVLG